MMNGCVGFLLALSVPCFAQGIVTTVAGSQWVFPDDGAVATTAALATLYGLASDQAGNVFIA